MPGSTSSRAPRTRGEPGRRRRRLLVGVLAVLVVLAGAGWFAAERADRTGVVRPAEQPRPLRQSMLLEPADLGLLGRRPWRELSTDDNTGGSGINHVCQASRFADAEGEASLVRRFGAGPPRRFVESIELSASADDAAEAYETTLGWYAGCDEARLQLLGSYRLAGVGDEGRLLHLRVPGPGPRDYLLGVVRTGELTVSTALETRGPDGPEPAAAAGVLTRAVRGLCASPAAGECPTRTQLAPVLPPPSGEEPGTLAVVDLPAIGRVDRPWSGTDARPDRTNLAATPCDRTSFVRAGAVHAVTRTYLLPHARRVPRRFGITETVGTFGNAARARAVVRRAREGMDHCRKKDLGKVSHARVRTRGYRGSELASWHVDVEVSRKVHVAFWTGFARVGLHVAQVTLTPAGRYDVDAETFRGLVTRARDRLFELDRVPAGHDHQEEESP